MPINRSKEGFPPFGTPNNSGIPAGLGSREDARVTVLSPLTARRRRIRFTTFRPPKERKCTLLYSLTRQKKRHFDQHICKLWLSASLSRSSPLCGTERMASICLAENTRGANTEKTCRYAHTLHTHRGSSFFFPDARFLRGARAHNSEENSMPSPG